MKKMLSLVMAVMMLLAAMPMGVFIASAATITVNGERITYTVSGSYATITDCSSSMLGDVIIPSVIDGYTVRSIGESAFSSCYSITGVTIPDSVTSIGDYAFFDCNALKSINIPYGVTSIGDGVFQYCSLKNGITLPESVRSIGKTAFANSGITSINIPKNVTFIGEDAFLKSKNTKSVYITDIAAWCNINFVTYNSNPLCFGGDLYLNNVKVENLKIPESITSISGNTFRGCGSLKNVTIHDKVTSIANYAFADCAALESVTFPANLTAMGNYAFSGCSSLTNINIPEGFTSISDYAFLNCTSLANVTIPDGVTTIGFSAFSGCSSLKNITLPDGITTLNSSAFYNCTSLTSIYLPSSIKSIGNGTFRKCTALTEITLPDGLEIVNYLLFEGCSALKKVNIPESVTKIDSESFKNCKSLIEIIIPDSVLSMGDGVFYYCTSLNNITLPDSITGIGDSSFAGCDLLQSIFIPKSVKIINQRAFYNCNGLKKVYYEGSSEDWQNISIYSYNTCLTNAEIYYNCSDIPDKISSVSVKKLPNKVSYTEYKEELDLTGGILSVVYNDGSSLEIDLATLDATGFDNSLLGEQTVTVSYGIYSTVFKVEVVARPIAFAAISEIPQKVQYSVGDILDVTGGKIFVYYPEGDYNILDITEDMVSGFETDKAGIKILTVTYRGYTDQFFVEVFEKANSDLDGDGKVSASDIAILRKNLLDTPEDTLKYDLNGDGSFDVRDLVYIKKLAG